MGEGIIAGKIKIPQDGEGRGGTGRDREAGRTSMNRDIKSEREPVQRTRA